MQQNKQLEANAKQAELPNLNFGLHAKPLSCSIHPTIVSNILDHYMRRPEKQQTVVGTLLGSVDGSKIDIQDSFMVPCQLNADKSINFDMVYNDKMLKFHRKVNPKEGLIGLYKTGTDIDNETTSLWYEYNNMLKDSKKKAQLDKPLLLLIDPTLQD